MRERRFLVTHLPDNGEIEIHGSEAHHLIHVLRLQPGDALVVFDGKGAEFRAVLTRCAETSAKARILNRLPGQDSTFELSLAVSIPKGGKMSLVVRMLTELGVSRVIPIVTERAILSSPSAVHDRRSRWIRIAAEACKQCGRNRVPEILEPISFTDLLDTELPRDRILVCPGGERLPKLARPPSCLAAIGPEGGWTEKEIDLAAERDFYKLGLGARTLRIETAAVAVATLIQSQWGDLQSGNP